jgi:carbon storage regulator
MLILSRRHGQSIRIDERVSVQVLAIRRRVVELGIEAPRWVQVDREEIFQRKRSTSNRDSASDQTWSRAGASVNHGIDTEVQRKRLFEALGIIEVSRHALASKLTTLDDESVMDGLKAAYRIVSDVAEALEKQTDTGASARSVAEDA